MAFFADQGSSPSIASGQKVNSNDMATSSASTNKVQLNEDNNTCNSDDVPSNQRQRSSLPMIDQLIDTVSKNVDNDEYFSIPQQRHSEMDLSTSTTELNGKLKS